MESEQWKPSPEIDAAVRAWMKAQGSPVNALLFRRGSLRLATRDAWRRLPDGLPSRFLKTIAPPSLWPGWTIFGWRTGCARARRPASS
jgi:hypothetical protein